MTMPGQVTTDRRQFCNVAGDSRDDRSHMSHGVSRIEAMSYKRAELHVHPVPAVADGFRKRLRYQRR